MIDEIHEQRTDPWLPTLRLADETILTLHAQFEQAVGTRTAGLLARGFQAADLFGFTNTNAINKTTVHFYLQIDNGAHYRCTVGNKVLAFERGWAMHLARCAEAQSTSRNSPPL